MPSKAKRDGSAKTDRSGNEPQTRQFDPLLRFTSYPVERVGGPPFSERESNRILILCRGPCARRSRDAARDVVLERLGLLLG